MKKSNWRRYLGGALAFLMAASLTGCGNKAQKGPAETINKNYVYSYEDLTLPIKLENINGLFYRDGKIYVVGVVYEEYARTYLCVMNEDGTDGQVIELGLDIEFDLGDMSGEGGESSDGEITSETAAEEPAAEDAGASDAEEEDVEEEMSVETDEDYLNIWYRCFVMDSKASLYAIAEVYQDYRDEEGNYISEETDYLMCWSESGELQWFRDLKEILQTEELFYINQMFVDNEDILWINSYNGIAAVDAQGNLVNKSEFEDRIDRTMYMDKVGNLFLLCWNEDYTKQSLRALDKKTLALGKEEEAPDAIVGGYSTMSGNGKYDFILSASTSLYTYNIGDAEPEKFMDTIDSDLNSNDLSNVTMLDDTHFIAVYRDRVNWEPVAALFTKVPPEEVKDKTLITLAGMYVDYGIKSRIVEFNKTNDTYRIQLREYEMYWSPDDYMAGYTRLNNDIISGKMPDILLVDSNMPLDSYIAKGLIADLYPFLAADEELSKEDFLTNILDAFSVKGKLYELVPEFQVQSLAGKTSLVGERTGWNMQEFQEFIDSMPEGMESFREMGRNEILNSILRLTKDEYIDSASGKCSFDSDEFVRLLEFSNQFPEEFDYSVFDQDDYWEKRESDYREERVALMPVYLSRYYDFNRTQKGDFGEEITLIGYPSKNRNGSAILANQTFAMAAKSGSQEGAWEFLRYYLTDEYQDQVSYCFPIKKTALLKLEQEATERPYWEREDGTREYYDDTYYINGVEIIMDPMTAEEAAAFTQFLSGLTLVAEYDTSMVDIVMEEAAAYFEGQKSARDVASIIQSRMRIYISESR